MPTNFHHHLQLWIHSMPVTPGFRPLPPCFGGTTHHGFHPQKTQVSSTVGLPVTLLGSHCLPLPFMAWTCWIHTLHSWFTSLLFQEGENRHQFQPNLESHQPPIPLSLLQGLGSDRIPSTTPGAEPPSDAKDSGSARPHSTHLETSSSNRP